MPGLLIKLLDRYVNKKGRKPLPALTFYSSIYLSLLLCLSFCVCVCVCLHWLSTGGNLGKTTFDTISSWEIYPVALFISFISLSHEWHWGGGWHLYTALPGSSFQHSKTCGSFVLSVEQLPHRHAVCCIHLGDIWRPQAIAKTLHCWNVRSLA